MIFLSFTIFKDENDTLDLGSFMVGIILIILSSVLFGFYIGKDDGYKQGQIDYRNGNIKIKDTTIIKLNK